ncbi:MAG: sugar ABC transporter permease [Propionicimonas sp.]
MALVAAAPVGYAIWLSLHKYSVRTAGLSKFVGLENYLEALSSPTWWAAVGNTFTFAGIAVALELAIGVAMALLLNVTFKGQGLLRSLVLIPYAVLTVVSAITWQTMFDPNLGLITRLLSWLNLPGGDVVWLAENGYAMAVVIAADVWKTSPFVALLVLAGLQSIPGDVYEAASMDGAGKWNTFWSITLPLLTPAIAVAAVFRILDALRVFDLPYVLTRGANGTSTMSMMAYQHLREQRLIGEGSTLSILTFITVMIVAVIYIRMGGGNLREISKER